MNTLQHEEEAIKNLRLWQQKPLLREIYQSFYQWIAKHLTGGKTVELGSGVGNIKEVLPNVLRTDRFPNPWIDGVENAYQLSFSDNTIGNLILFDVFHHLRYPATALHEFQRVLVNHGRVLIFEPYMSVLGRLVFGLFHPEELGLNKEIEMFAPQGFSGQDDRYYAAQGNASRIFYSMKYHPFLKGWTVVAKHKISAISYVASGGYSMPQLYPSQFLPLMKLIDKICDLIPSVFATRCLIVLEKKII